MRIKSLFCVVAMLCATICGPEAGACSRVVYKGNDSLCIVGRSLDWKPHIPTELYVYPRGVEKAGNDLPGSVRWTSRYGAVYAVSYGGGVTEGMNEKGLVVNGLFCKGTVYRASASETDNAMSLAMFPAWILDLSATTDEAVELLRTTRFNIVAADFDGGTSATLHWGITDASGKTAVVEFDHGKINIYNADSVAALTNDPTWPQMIATNRYWQQVGGVNMLPGTVRSTDRFVRADFFEHHVRRTADTDTGVAIVRSIMATVSVPYDYAVEGEPNVSMTQWRSYADLRDLRYYFDRCMALGVFYIDLSKCDLAKGAPVMKISEPNMDDFAGCANRLLEKTRPFVPMYR